MTRISIKTMATHLASSMENRNPTPHRNLESKMRTWQTARSVTTEVLRSMDAEYLEGLKVRRHEQKQKTKKLEAIRTKEEAKLVAKAAVLNLSVDQCVTTKRKGKGISSSKKCPKKAKGNDADSLMAATPSPRFHAVTSPAQPSRESTQYQ